MSLLVLFLPNPFRLLRTFLRLVNLFLVLLVLVVDGLIVERLLLAGRELLLFDLVDAKQIIVQTFLLILPQRLLEPQVLCDPSAGVLLFHLLLLHEHELLLRALCPKFLDPH